MPTSEQQPPLKHERIEPPRRRRGPRDFLLSGVKWTLIAIFTVYLVASFQRTDFNLYKLISGSQDIKRVMYDLSHPDFSWVEKDADGNSVINRKLAPDVISDQETHIAYTVGPGAQAFFPTVGVLTDDGVRIKIGSLEDDKWESFSISADYADRQAWPPELCCIVNHDAFAAVMLVPEGYESEFLDPSGEKPKQGLILSLSPVSTEQGRAAAIPGKGTADDPYQLVPDTEYVLRLIDETQAPAKPGTVPVLLDEMNETVMMSLVGTLLSVLLSFPLSFLAARNLTKGTAAGQIAYNVVRFIFNILRAFPPIILAIIFVFMVGPGPFPGVLALALHSIGMLGKLFSEAIEGVDLAPIEAVRATGANNNLIVWFGILPQVLPQFVAFSLYRWDINIRMSIILGIVGAGGIGFLLDQYIRLFQYQKASTCFLIILLAVTVLDWGSSWLREKMG